MLRNISNWLASFRENDFENLFAKNILLILVFTEDNNKLYF